ncbi:MULTISPECIES: hypothetical protein [unclassified Salinibacterium]|uniref:hypothetical protein n=1 Tax=unclassified Salinibacterium TaxID=2632331 RepID=UPI0018CCB26E|nr:MULTISPECIES: hypothetical protein [unclassified Salinibacterium]MBH0024745.1 hypothetical protein [Salinibacterium sp. SWN248]MBH0084091.1 hypothetical protein [Salinibacterium sp. SWN167]
MRSIVIWSVVLMAVSLALVVAGTQGFDLLLYIGLASFGLGAFAALWVQLLGYNRVEAREIVETSKGYNTISSRRYELPLVDDQTGIVLRAARKSPVG